MLGQLLAQSIFFYFHLDLGWFGLTQYHLTHFYEMNFQQVAHQNNGGEKQTHSSILCKGGIIFYEGKDELTQGEQGGK